MAATIRRPAGRGASCGVWTGAAAALLLVGFAGRALLASREKSPAFDEPAHLAAGLRVLREGDLALYHENPPLLRALAALPAHLLGAALPGDPAGLSPWQYGARFAVRNEGRLDALFLAARAPTAALGVLLGLLVFAWSRRANGPAGAVLSLFLFASCPNLLANGALVTGDIGFSLAWCLSAFAFLRYLEAPGWRRALPAGAALGLALAVKFSSALLVPAFLALCLLRRRGRPAHLLGMGALALFVVHALYLFQDPFAPLGSFRFQSGPLARLNVPVLSGIPAPLPFEYLKGLDALILANRNNAAFLFGALKAGTFPDYYPVSFLLKTPVPVLVLALMRPVLPGPRPSPWRGAGLLLPAAALALPFALLVPANIGIRYVLPLYPLLYIALGAIPGALRLRRERIVAAGALVALGASSLAAHPDYLSYMNALATGPARGHRLLVDANLDWDQDLPALRRFQETHGTGRIHLGQFGFLPARLAGVDASLLHFVPVEGWIAVGASRLRLSGALSVLPPLEGVMRSLRWLNRLPAVDHVAGSILLYRVPDLTRIFPLEEVEAFALLHRGIAALREGRRLECVALFEEACRGAPSLIEARIALGLLRGTPPAEEEIDALRREVEEALRREPLDPLLRQLRLVLERPQGEKR